jgi:hypothetical protein
MPQQHYTSSITAAVTAKQAFDAIGDIAAWWTIHVDGNARQTGDVFTVHFGAVYKTIALVEVVEDKKIVWRVNDCNMPWLHNKKEWTGTEVVWQIAEKDGQTEVLMTHIGLVPEIECYGACEKGWNYFIQESLLKLLAQGKGVPDTRPTV